MKQTVELKNPILINGVQVKELSYDPQEITALQFSQACARSAAISKQNTSINMKFKENDYALHLYLGFMAVIAVNPEIDIADLERMKGFDTIEFTNIGLLFITRTPGGASQESKSGEQSGSTAELSTPAKQTLEKSV